MQVTPRTQYVKEFTTKDSSRRVFSYALFWDAFSLENTLFSVLNLHCFR